MTELLSPAGGREALVAAVQNGADAVYMGFGSFNARRSARNFSDEEFLAAVRYCHLRGVKVYLTLNTLVTDRELPALAETARRASEYGVDAIFWVGNTGNNAIEAIGKLLQQHETFACHFNREILGNLLFFFQRHIVGVIPGIRSGEPVGIAGRRYGFCRRERSRQPNDCAQRQRHQPMALFALEHDVCPPH